MTGPNARAYLAMRDTTPCLPPEQNFSNPCEMGYRAPFAGAKLLFLCFVPTPVACLAQDELLEHVGRV